MQNPCVLRPSTVLRAVSLIVALTVPTQGLAQTGDGALDRKLRAKLRRAGVTALAAGPARSGAEVRLGRMLFFDKELSGNRDIACATCHHPLFATGDGLSLSLGTGGEGLGVMRVRGEGRGLIPRNAPELFNRGAAEWATQFWDSRVQESRNGALLTPAGASLPEGLDGVLAAQAMFPVTSRDEMRGALADTHDIHGGENELSALGDGDNRGIWDALMRRLLAIDGYVGLFAAAYPGVGTNELDFGHAANAIAAFEADAFTLLDSPFDAYLGGDSAALGDAEKRGGRMFFGKARCGRCHNGALLTDQQHYNLAVPQLGPGKAPEAPLDFGRARETGVKKHRFHFRTPPLRNVAATGPWMHNGAYTTLEGAVRHHLTMVRALKDYDASQLSAEIALTVLDDAATQRLIRSTLRRPVTRPIRPLKDVQFTRLMAFLQALTSPSLSSLMDTVPASVPSGLPVDGAG